MVGRRNQVRKLLPCPLSLTEGNITEVNSSQLTLFCTTQIHLTLLSFIFPFLTLSHLRKLIYLFHDMTLCSELRGEYEGEIRTLESLVRSLLFSPHTLVITPLLGAQIFM